MSGLDAFGVQLERSDMAPTTPVFTAIANVTNVKSPKLSREAYDVTAHDSANGWREFVGGLKDAGEISIEINYDPTGHDTLIGDFEDDVARDYKLVWPGGATWALKAFLTGFSAEAPVDDKLSAELTLKVTGKPTITAGP